MVLILNLVDVVAVAAHLLVQLLLTRRGSGPVFRLEQLVVTLVPGGDHLLHALLVTNLEYTRWLSDGDSYEWLDDGD